MSIMSKTTDTRVCLVRHGETDWNKLSRLQGHIDIGLNSTGITQAKATASLLADIDFDAIYSSDLSRALETAKFCAADSPISTLSSLRERHYGLFQGLSYAEAKLAYPDYYAQLTAREVDFSPLEGGESLREFSNRVCLALESCREQHSGGTILIVTHGGVLEMIRRYITAEPLHLPRKFPIPNAAINWLAHDANAQNWRLEQWAEDSHLQTSLDDL